MIDEGREDLIVSKDWVEGGGTEEKVLLFFTVKIFGRGGTDGRTVAGAAARRGDGGKVWPVSGADGRVRRGWCGPRHPCTSMWMGGQEVLRRYYVNGQVE